MIKVLNSGILKEKEFAIEKDKNGKDICKEGNVLILKEDIQNDIDNLRNLIWVLLCIYDEKDENFQCVFEEVEKNGGLARFNDDENEG